MKNFDFDIEEKKFLNHLYLKYGLESILIYQKDYSLSDESLWLQINNLYDPQNSDQDHRQLMEIIDQLLLICDEQRKVKVMIADGQIRAIAA